MPRAKFQTLPEPMFYILLCLVCVGLYALSWWLSIRFYEKREL